MADEQNRETEPRDDTKAGRSRLRRSPLTDMTTSADDSTARTNEVVQASFEAKPFGRVSTQILGGLFLYIAALYPLTFLAGSLISSSRGGDMSWLPGDLAWVYLLAFGPLMGLSLQLGIVVHGIGTVTWLIMHARHRPPFDLLTIIRSIPPTVLSVVSIIFGSVFLPPMLEDLFKGGLFRFLTSVSTYFSVYLVIAVVGIVLEIVARRRRPASTVDSPVVSSD